MAYQTGTATDPADLLDKLRVFAAANGFTINFFGDRTAGTAPRKALQITKGVLIGSFLSDSAPNTAIDPGPMIGTYCHGAYVSGNGTENQLQASEKIYCNDMAGPYQAYHFFCDNGGSGQPYLYVVVETASGVFKHFGMGRLDTIGAITTGVFCYACRWKYQTTGTITINDADSTYHNVPFDSNENTNATQGGGTRLRADSESISPRWFTSYGSGFGSRISGGVRGLNGPSTAIGQQRSLLWGPMRNAGSQRSGRTTLSPCLLAVDRQTNLQSMVGAPPNIRWVSLRYLDPGQVITLGTDNWKVFPVIRKNGTTGQVNSDLYGYAYRVN